MGTWWLDVGTAGVVRSGWMWTGTSGSVAVPRCGHRCLDVGTSGCEVPRCRYQVPRCRHRFLDVGTASRRSKGYVTSSRKTKSDQVPRTNEGKR